MLASLYVLIVILVAALLFEAVGAALTKSSPPGVFVRIRGEPAQVPAKDCAGSHHNDNRGEIVMATQSYRERIKAQRAEARAQASVRRLVLEATKLASSYQITFSINNQVFPPLPSAPPRHDRDPR